MISVRASVPHRGAARVGEVGDVAGVVLLVRVLGLLVAHDNRADRDGGRGGVHRAAELDRAAERELLVGAKVELHRVDEVREVDLDLDEDVHHLERHPVDRHEARVRVVHEQLAAERRREALRGRGGSFVNIFPQRRLLR